jgi:hypothetical protein
MVVVLPAPFGPRKPKIDPAFTLKEILSTAFDFPYVFDRSFTVMASPTLLPPFGTAVAGKGDLGPYCSSGTTTSS